MALDRKRLVQYASFSEGFMKNEFTAISKRDGELYIVYCPEIPGANGQGRTKDEAREDLVEAIELILEDRREDALRGFRPMPFERLSQSNETEHAAPAPPEVRLLPHSL